MTTDTSLDESVFSGDHTNKQRHRHSSADANNSPGIFRPRRLSSEFKDDVIEDEDSSKRTTLIEDTQTTIEDSNTDQTDSAAPPTDLLSSDSTR